MTCSFCGDGDALLRSPGRCSCEAKCEAGKKKIQYSTVKFPKRTQTASNTGRTNEINESWRRRGHKIQQLHPTAYRLGLYYGDVNIRVYETHGAFLVKRWVVS